MDYGGINGNWGNCHEKQSKADVFGAYKCHFLQTYVCAIECYWNTYGDYFFFFKKKATTVSGIGFLYF